MTVYVNNSRTGYCYIILYKNGRVKIGRTKNPYTRFANHRLKGDTNPSEFDIDRFFMSEIIEDHIMSEALLINALCRIGKQFSPEVFSDIDFEKAFNLFINEVFEAHEVFNKIELKGKHIVFGKKPNRCDSILKDSIKPFGGFATAAQIRMAVALIGDKTVDIAKRAGISRSTMSNMIKMDSAQRTEGNKIFSPSLSSSESLTKEIVRMLADGGFKLTVEGGVIPIPAPPET